MLRDVGADLHAFEVDFVDGLVGAFAGLLACWCGGGDGEDASAVGVDVAFGLFGSGVVDADTWDCFGAVEACDQITLAWVGWIVLCGEDDGHGVIVGEADIGAIEGSCGGGHEEFEGVGFEACEQGLAFGVSEADIELEDLWSAWSEHDPGVDDSSELDLVSAECVGDWDEDFGFDLVVELVSEGS